MSALNSWLAGVRVIDLSQYLPGPLATLFLASIRPAAMGLGAEWVCGNGRSSFRDVTQVGVAGA